MVDIDRMKIAYDPQIFFEQAYGGASRYFCEIAPRIARFRGAEVTVVAPMHVNAYLEHAASAVVSGFRLSRQATQLSVPLRGLGMLVGDVMLRALNPDIIHETYFSPFRFGPRRAKRIVTIHDMIHEKFAASFSRTDRTSRFKTRSAERADHVICVSESTRRDVMEILGLPEDRLTVVYQGVGLTTAEDDSEIVNVAERGPFLLYVGNRGRYKNFHNLLTAFGRSTELRRNFNLVCFGGGPFLRQELQAISTLGLTDQQVCQVGGDDKTLAQLYRRATVFIYPSRYEGFGIPPLEAMTYGCPVVCSDTSSIPEVVGDAGEYCDPENVDSIAAAVERVAASSSRRDELIRMGHEQVNKFSWDRCAAETYAVYDKLM